MPAQKAPPRSRINGAELRARLRKGRTWVYMQCKKGALKPHYIGDTQYFWEDEVEAFEQEQMARPQSERRLAANATLALDGRRRAETLEDTLRRSMSPLISKLGCTDGGEAKD